MKNVFFIQRAAIDTLLLNNATAIEICTYLVISKYTDRHGFQSGVGFKTIKERLGVGQKKVDEAIIRLKSMTTDGQRLLFSLEEWLHKKKKSPPQSQDISGWVCGWFESEYKHQVWLSNELIGKNGDKKRPLNFFTKGSGRDNHARLLLLLYKYHNRQYSGVNYNLVSVPYDREQGFCYRINGFDFFKSRSSSKKYHVSNEILDLYGIKSTYKETCDVLNQLILNSYFNVSVSVLGDCGGPSISARKVPIKRNHTKRIVNSHSQIENWKNIKELRLKLKDHRTTYKLEIIPEKKDSRSIAIGLKKIYTKTPLKASAVQSFDKMLTFPGTISEVNSQFVYRLDYKSANKHSINMTDSLAGEIEEIAVKGGFESASRKGRFYDWYWWFNPGITAIELVGIIKPVHIPETKLSIWQEAQTILDDLKSVEAYQSNKTEPEPVLYPFSEED